MRSLLTILLLIAPLLANAFDLCGDPVPKYGASDNRETVSPMATVAPGILREDLAAGNAASDPLEGIRIYLAHNFYMGHPEASGPVGYSRCGAPEQYQQLSDAVTVRVNALAGAYKQQRWFLGDADNGYPGNKDARPGLLRLWILANRIDQFASEAEKFLRSAVDDPKAPEYFTAIKQLANARIGELRNYAEARESLQSMDFKGGLGLLPFEDNAIDELEALVAKLDGWREPHVNHWLDREQTTFAELQANPPANEVIMLTVMPLVSHGVSQLSNARKVGIDRHQAKVNSQAEQRGDWLMAQDRHSEAAPYYSFAGATAKEARAKELAGAKLQTLRDNLESSLEDNLRSFKKTDAERQAFEDDTDDLADELGIDLDDF